MVSPLLVVVIYVFTPMFIKFHNLRDINSREPDSDSGQFFFGSYSLTPKGKGNLSFLVVGNLIKWYLTTCT